MSLVPCPVLSRWLQKRSLLKQAERLEGIFPDVPKFFGSAGALPSKNNFLQLATRLLKACQNFCQRKEVKAMLRCLLALLVLMASLSTAQEAVDWSSLVEKVMPAVVTIVSADEKDIVQGSGFIISSDGKIVTNFHVVAGKRNILARRSDGSFLVIKSILASDKANDLAVLQAEGRNLPFVRLGDSDKVKVGEAICVIGSPMLLEGTVSGGIISAVRDLGDGRKLLQITAPVSKGSSGSPVFNRKGEVVGVASFTLSEGQNLNFAVPSNAVKPLLHRSGISTKPLPPLPTLSLEERFEQAYQEALRTAQKIEEPFLRSLTFCKIAQALAKIERTEQANQVSNLAFQAAQKVEVDVVLPMVVEAMAEAGQFEYAIQIASRIEDARLRSEALSKIIKALMIGGQMEQANQILRLALAQKFKFSLDQSCAFSEIAKALAEAKQFDLALQIAQKIEHVTERSYALSGIVKALCRSGQLEWAKQVLKLALRAAQEATREDPFFDLSSAIKELAEALAMAGQFDLALQTAQKIKHPLSRSLSLVEITGALAKARQFERALRIAQEIEDASYRPLALSEIAKAMAEAGKFDLALQITQKIEDARVRSLALISVTKALAEAGQFERAVEIAETISEPIARLQALAAIIAVKRDQERVKRGNGEG